MDTIKFEAKGIPDNSGRFSIWELGAVLLFLVSFFVWPPVSIAYAVAPTQEDFNLRKAFLIANACEITYLEDKKVLNTIKEMGIDVFDLRIPFQAPVPRTLMYSWPLPTTTH